MIKIRPFKTTFLRIISLEKATLKPCTVLFDIIGNYSNVKFTYSRDLRHGIDHRRLFRLRRFSIRIRRRWRGHRRRGRTPSRSCRPLGSPRSWGRRGVADKLLEMTLWWIKLFLVKKIKYFSNESFNFDCSSLRNWLKVHCINKIIQCFSNARFLDNFLPPKKNYIL